MPGGSWRRGEWARQCRPERGRRRSRARGGGGVEGRDGLAAREPDPNRVGQQDQADHPSREGRSGQRGLARGDTGKPQLPLMVRSGQDGNSNPE